MAWYMNKQKGSKREEDRKRKDQSSPDTGQGSAGNFGSDGDLGEDRVSGNDEKSKKDRQDSPIPIKQKPKTESSS
jgi:hypothetical protein